MILVPSLFSLVQSIRVRYLILIKFHNGLHNLTWKIKENGKFQAYQRILKNERDISTKKHSWAEHRLIRVNEVLNSSDLGAASKIYRRTVNTIHEEQKKSRDEKK